MWLACSNHTCSATCKYKSRQRGNHLLDEDQRIYTVADEFILRSDLKVLIASCCPEDKRLLNHEIEYCIIQDAVEVLEDLPNIGCYNISPMLNNKNQTALHLAFYKKAHRLLNYSNGSVLFSRFRNHVNYVDRYGLSHLHIACVTGNIDVVKIFLDEGADINAQYHSDPERSRTNFTPLHFAATNECRDVVELLLQHGADVNVTDFMGRTPLHVACGVTETFDRWMRGTGQLNHLESFSDYRVIELLLNSGSDVNTKDKRGNTPLTYCFQKFNVGTTETNNYRDQRIMDLKSRQLKKIEVLLKHGADIKIANKIGNILHWIIKDLQCLRFPVNYLNISFNDSLHAELIEQILATNKEVDVNAKNFSGETPLHLAISLISVEIVKVLLKYNADFSGIKFDQKNHIDFVYPSILPNLEAIRNVISIIDLLYDIEYIFTLEDNLYILQFMMNNCKNYDSIDIRDKYNMECILWNALYYGSAVQFDYYYHKLRDTTKISSNRLRYDFLTKINELQEHVYFYSDCKEKLGFIDRNIFNVPRYARYRNQKMKELTSKLSSEVASMKTTYLSSGISLYNVMVGSHSSIYRHIKDSNIDKLSMNFPSYEKFIQSHVAKSLIRNYIEKTAYQYLKLPALQILPELCWKIIVSYLRNEDILSLSAVFTSSDMFLVQ